jgi:hypothetical protein
MDPFWQKMTMIFTACGMIVLGVWVPDAAAKNMLFVTAGVIFGGATIRRPEDLAPSTGMRDS